MILTRQPWGHRMRRKLFTFFSALSLLLCVAVCVLWVRGRRNSDYVSYTRAEQTLVVGSSGGGKVMVAWHSHVRAVAGFYYLTYPVGIGEQRLPNTWEFAGFAVRL